MAPGWQRSTREKTRMATPLAGRPSSGNGGFPSQTRTFRAKAEAQAWASVVESEMVRGIWVDRSEAESTTLHSALHHYVQDVLPRKKSRDREAGFTRQWIARPLCPSLPGIHSPGRRIERTGLDLMEIKAITGHKSLQRLSRYTHLRTAKLADRLGRSGAPDGRQLGRLG